MDRRYLGRNNRIHGRSTFLHEPLNLKRDITSEHSYDRSANYKRAIDPDVHGKRKNKDLWINRLFIDANTLLRLAPILS